jgi:hypothetical protein
MRIRNSKTNNGKLKAGLSNNTTYNTSNPKTHRINTSCLFLVYIEIADYSIQWEKLHMPVTLMILSLMAEYLCSSLGGHKI